MRVCLLTKLALMWVASVCMFGIHASCAQSNTFVIQDCAFDPPAAQDVMRRLAELMRTLYVFPDRGEQCAHRILERMVRGDYPLERPNELAKALESELFSITRDRHLRISHVRGEQAEPDVPSSRRSTGKKYNHGFRKVERLVGNVGYLEMTGFHEPQSAAETALAAMTFLQNSEAIILDLSSNGGGSAEMVKLMASWLLPPKTALSGIYWRASGQVEQAWTEAWLGGARRLLEVPVFVITSDYTFSAAEALAYDLQTAGRATIIGTRTGGGAHPGEEFSLGSGFHVWMPLGRAIHPKTASNWEGRGVTPDQPHSSIGVKAAAHALALQQIADGLEPSGHRDQILELQEWADSLGTPTKLPEGVLARLVGKFGSVSIIDVDGSLFYAPGGRAPSRLGLLSDVTFCVEGQPGTRLVFEGMHATAKPATGILCIESSGVQKRFLRQELGSRHRRQGAKGPFDS